MHNPVRAFTGRRTIVCDCSINICVAAPEKALYTEVYRTHAIGQIQCLEIRTILATNAYTFIYQQFTYGIKYFDQL